MDTEPPTGIAYYRLRMVDTDGSEEFSNTVVVIAFSSLAALVDVRMMVIRKWKWVFWRLTLSGLARIPLVFIPSQRAPVGVFIALALPIAASAIIGLIALHRVEPAMLEDAAPSEPDAAAVTSPNGDFDAPHGVAPFRYAMVNWVAHLAANAPQFVLPVIVFQNVEPEKYASFFQAWAIAAFAFILPVTIGKVLLSESAQVSTTPPEPQSDLDKALGEADSDDADFSGEESTDLDDGLERNTRLALVLSVGSMALATQLSFVVPCRCWPSRRRLKRRCPSCVRRRTTHQSRWTACVRAGC